MKKDLNVILAAALITSLVLAGCGAPSSISKRDYKNMSNSSASTEAMMYSDDVYDYDYDYEYEAAAEEGYDGTSEGLDPVEVKDTSRKIIKNVNMDVETEEFDTLINNVQDKIDALGGYCQNIDIGGRGIYDKTSNRYANITARIPADKLDSFVKSVENASNITNKSESAEDVTLDYADTKAHVDSLRVEQERLNELLSEAEDVDTIIVIESRLSEVRYEIESYESKLRLMDNRVSYSTVYLNIREVSQYTPVERELTAGERIAIGLAESFEDVADNVIDIIIDLPMIIFVLIIVAFFVFLIIGFIKLIIYIFSSPETRALRKQKKALKKQAQKERKAEKKIKGNKSVSDPAKDETDIGQ